MIDIQIYWYSTPQHVSRRNVQERNACTTHHAIVNSCLMGASMFMRMQLPCSSTLIWCIAILYMYTLFCSAIQDKRQLPKQIWGLSYGINYAPTLTFHTLSFLLPVCPTSTSVPAWQIAVTTVVGFLILGFLVSLE